VTVESPPATTAVLDRVTPVYEEHPGWRESTAGVRRFADLPKNAQSYVERIEALLGAPIEFVSVAPEREQVIIR
jgi:adenylosuccinate synthase